jgi:transposase
LVAVEATGGFEAVVAAALAGAGLPAAVVNPAQVRAFAKALGKRAKTAPIDAAVQASADYRGLLLAEADRRRLAIRASRSLTG